LIPNFEFGAHIRKLQLQILANYSTMQDSESRQHEEICCAQPCLATSVQSGDLLADPEWSGVISGGSHGIGISARLPALMAADVIYADDTCAALLLDLCAGFS
jgi:hypothetical protein